MKRVYHTLLLALMCLINFQCQKELSGDHIAGAGVSTGPSPIIVTLQGNILDESGQPAMGVKMTAGNQTTVSDIRGYFRITDAALDKNTSLVVAEKPGYFKAYRSFSATTGVNQVVIQLIPKRLAGTINATTGGEVSLANGASVKLAANGVIAASGNPYSGQVQVFAAYLDPSAREITKTVPGSFMADDKDNKRVALLSYGMLAVELQSAAGEKLQVAPGAVANLRFPIPAARRSSAPDSISLWFIDEKTGVWKEEGMARKFGDEYAGVVTHFSYWNCDMPFPVVSFKAILTTTGHEPLRNVSVSVVQYGDTVSYAGFAHGYTDSLGQVAGYIPLGRPLRLMVYDECYDIVYTKDIGPFTAFADLGEIQVPESEERSVTLRGKLISCSNSPVVNGFAMIYWHNFLSIVKCNAAGEFSFRMLMCASGQQSFDIVGIDGAAQQQGGMLTIPIQGKLTDAGEITACGTDATQFVRYNLDDTAYTISTYGNDSLYGTSYLRDSLQTFDSYIQANNKRGRNAIGIGFTGQAKPGKWSLISIHANAYREVVAVQPFVVNLTTFPATNGDFYEGSFSGSFNDKINGTGIHKISGSFRIRRY